jgi:hypothetical protein
MARLTHTLAAAALGAMAAVASPLAAAQNTVWKCTDADGRPHYTNVKEEAKAPNCRVVAESKVSTVPANAFPTATAAAARPNAAATPTPANFPRVDAGTQKARDESRRKSLEDELAAEQRSLSDARAKLADQGDAAQRKPLQESVERHERNVAALQRELSNLK